MNKMLSKLIRIGRRQLHTIVSRDIIKPSSPTPSHCKTYGLSLFDQIAINTYTPIVAFYPRSSVYQSSHDKTLKLKNSLSQTLTRYYPFAGRLKQYDPTYVDCNDEGVDFIEACNDSSLSDFLQHSKHEDLDQLFPNDLLWYDPNLKGDKDGNNIACALNVQVNHFACGGVAVATSLNHKIADGRSALNFLCDWAKVTAQSSSGNQKDASLIINPLFDSQTIKTNLPELIPYKSRVGCVTRSFVFPNGKLNNLKDKVRSMTLNSGQEIKNPTRVEALTWLIHKCAVEAANKTNSGTFKATGMGVPVDMRNILIEKLPGTTIGNLDLLIHFPTRNQNELEPHMFIGEIRKQKILLQSIKNFETATSIAAEMSVETAIETSKRNDAYYIYSSLCRFPTYGIDFGWGKPAKVTIGGTIKNLTILMDTCDDTGIEALVCLEKDDMKTFENNPELLAFC